MSPEQPVEPTLAELKINVLDACVNLLEICGRSERREQIRGELLAIRSEIARKAGLAGGRGRKKKVCCSKHPVTH